MAASVDLSRVDLLDLIGRDVVLKRMATTHGGEYAGPCPWCGGDDRFRVWPQHPDGRGRYWCRGCEKAGDAVQYLRDREGLSYPAACERLGVALQDRTPSTPAPPKPKRAEWLTPPGPTWQAAAWAFVYDCERSLWADSGAAALTWLLGRGLTDETIKVARLGYHDGANEYRDREGWGLFDEGKPIWLPRGIVIPWILGKDLWRVNIRRPEGKPKYAQPAGCEVALYGDDAVSSKRPVVMVEGEFDALTIGQVAGDLVAAVATGSTSGARRTRWLANLALPPVVLVAFDADEGGEKGAAWWLERLENAKRWRPLWNDANAMAQGGADVRAWLAAGIGDEQPFVAQDSPEPDLAAELVQRLINGLAAIKRAQAEGASTAIEDADRRWCELMAEWNREMVKGGRREPTYLVGDQVFVRYGCEDLVQEVMQ